ncbi:MobQ family relaxase [Pukyongiella litopenaei]|uniref:Molybdopterin-guanine dinucleotide biosynthesis protein MobA n=1 Tax=Pukyongiella litopenaei TaxID=2605946 RepID=A0A5C2H444_9RHOB|nr:MobQ family relaxase [Pukyongiella litopenaei]QEP30656.1 molybdopterin-guanine dinucleotide biosynthesis protein MobA [Pukyongiella litopenaei]
MASYHLSVKTVKRSAGRTATAAAAYRAGERLSCAREGRVHDYTRKQGIEESFILAPADAPGWAQDRAGLWNAAEARETRRNSVTAREWELALPAELSAEGRAELARGFAQELVSRYGIAADVAIHAPHRDGDQRNHHAHVLTTTRVLGSEGLTDKTRILDAARTGGAEIAEMRGLWAQMQNAALERAEMEARVDHRSLEDQREAALSRGDELAAMALDRDPEIKLGPAASAMERKAMREAERDGVAYEPVTERGGQVHGVRQQRSLMADLLERMGRAREAYAQAREAEAGRLSAATEAARALFSGAGARDFAASFTRAYQDREAARQRALEEERAQAREAERVAALEAARGQFIEQVVVAWQDSREIANPDVAKQRQRQLVGEVEKAAERFGCTFDDIAGPANARANEIRDQRTREAEIELDRFRHRDRSDGLGL